MTGVGRRDISGIERAACALTGYIAGSFVVVPFDRVKTLMQAAPGKTPSPSSVALEIFRTHGVRGLYRGLDTQLLIAPYTVLYYTIYDELLQLQQNRTFAPLSSAIVARTIETTLRMPLELLRTQLQAAEGHVTLWQLMSKQRKQPMGIWMRGWSSTLLRDVPFSAIYWFAYEFAKKRVPEPGHIENSGLRTLAHSFGCGGSAGMFAAFVTTPVDVVKTLRQKLPSNAPLSGRVAVPLSNSYSDILRCLTSNPLSAFTGLAPRLLRIPLGMATMMSGLETSKWVFQRRLVH